MQSDNNNERTPRRKHHRIRWGRALLLLLVVAALLTTVFWGAVWAYNNLISPPKTETVAAEEKIVEDEKLNQRINVLLLGIDDGDSEALATEPKRTDAMVVVSFDPENNKVSTLSIPRDTMVQLPGHYEWDKINAAYAYGGVAMAKQTVANLLRIPIHYYALANWKGFIEVINIIGGVDLYVDTDMDYEDPYADLSIHIKHGYQHLDGEKSGQYVRFRSDELGDIGRVQRQQKFLKALGMQMFSVENITKIPKIISTVSEHIETDMSTATVLKAARSFNIIKDNNIKSGMIYGEFYDSPRTGISYWRTSRSNVEKSLKEVDIPYMASTGGDDPVASAPDLREAGQEFATPARRQLQKAAPKSTAAEEKKEETSGTETTVTETREEPSRKSEIPEQVTKPAKEKESSSSKPIVSNKPQKSQSSSKKSSGPSADGLKKVQVPKKN